MINYDLKFLRSISKALGTFDFIEKTRYGNVKFMHVIQNKNIQFSL